MPDLAMLIHGISGRARSLTRRRTEVLAEIEECRALYEDMVRRVVALGAPEPAGVPGVRQRFGELTGEAKTAASEEDLDQQAIEAGALSNLRAYFCPESEIVTEAKTCLLQLVDWGVPNKSLDALKEATAGALAAKYTGGKLDAAEAAATRGALHAMYEEYDVWNDYVDEYNENTSFWAKALLSGIGICALVALFMLFGWSPRVLSLVVAAAAGAMASVIARLPGVTSSGEWEVNLRGYQTRIGTGIVGSLVGIGLLGSGLISISLPKEWQSADRLLGACLSKTDEMDVEEAQRAVIVPAATSSTPGAAASAPTSAAPVPQAVLSKVRCGKGGGLFVIALTMLLGFSERLLTSLETRVVPGAAPPGAPSPRG